jgi:hypothetical protein
MPPIVASAEVERPATETFAYATDPTRFSEWQKAVVDGHMDADGPPTVGDRCLTTRRIGGANGRGRRADVTWLDSTSGGRAGT